MATFGVLRGKLGQTFCQLLELARSHPLVIIEPQPTCHVMSISSTETVLYLRPWCSSSHYEQVLAEVQQAVKEGLARVG